MQRIPVVLLMMLIAMLTPDRAVAQVKGIIHIGVTGSSFRGGALKNAMPIYRLAGGAGLRYSYPSGLELESGLDYAVKGAELEGMFEDIPIEGTSEITYLSVPVLIGYRWHTMGRLQPRVVGGAALAFKTDARISYRAVGSGIEQTTIDDGIGERDLGWIVGVDVDTLVGGETLMGGLRLILGQSNARTVEPEVLNTTLTAFVGIVF